MADERARRTNSTRRLPLSRGAMSPLPGQARSQLATRGPRSWHEPGTITDRCARRLRLHARNRRTRARWVVRRGRLELPACGV